MRMELCNCEGTQLAVERSTSERSPYGRSQQQERQPRIWDTQQKPEASLGGPADRNSCSDASIQEQAPLPSPTSTALATAQEALLLGSCSEFFMLGKLTATEREHGTEMVEVSRNGATDVIWGGGGGNCSKQVLQYCSNWASSGLSDRTRASNICLEINQVTLDRKYGHQAATQDLWLALRLAISSGQ